MKNNYFDLLKSVKLCESRNSFIEMNKCLNENKDFKKLTNAEKFCIKAEMYQSFKDHGFKDSKKFNFLICIKNEEK